MSNFKFDNKKSLWLGVILSILSGLLLTLSMPGIDYPYIGWIALVPLLFTLINAKPNYVFLLSIPFGIFFSIGVHNWYPNVFPPALGYFLIFAVGMYYAGVLNLGIWLYSRLPDSLKLLAVPVSWSAIEFLKYIAPILQDWWFVLLADSQWRFPPALQILGITGFPGLSFLVMLVNFSAAILIYSYLKKDFSKIFRISLSSITIAIVFILTAALSIPKPNHPFKIVVITDMVYQLPAMHGLGNFAGLLKKSPDLSQALFDNDLQLTGLASSEKPAFVVWPENGISDIDAQQFTSQLKQITSSMNLYLAADMNWNSQTGLYNTAVLFGPDGEEIGRRAKINIVSEEAAAGITPGPRTFPVFTTNYGKAGLAVCWDVHRLWIIRELARSGAQIILLPMDNDFQGNGAFPPFHAANAVFRAAENHLAFGLGTVNGLSMVIDPYGRITSEGKVNIRGVTIGETFVTSQKTIYTLFGDWFGWTLTAALAAMILISLRNNK